MAILKTKRAKYLWINKKLIYEFFSGREASWVHISEVLAYSFSMLAEWVKNVCKNWKEYKGVRVPLKSTTSKRKITIIWVTLALLYGPHRHYYMGHISTIIWATLAQLKLVCDQFYYSVESPYCLLQLRKSEDIPKVRAYLIGDDLLRHSHWKHVWSKPQFRT